MEIGDLSAAEAEVWNAFPKAETVDLRAGTGERDAAGGEEWGPERSVRAEVIAALLLGARAAEPGLAPAIRLSGARITGLLDLSFAEVRYAVLLQDCYWDVEPRLSGARLRLVRLSGSFLPGLQIADAQIDGLLLLDRCHFGGEVVLTGTRVNGILSLSGGRLRGDPALSAVSLAVERDLICTGMVASGECVLSGAQVGGRLVLDGAVLDHPGGKALTADGLVTRRGVFCLDGFTTQGEVRFPDAQVGRLFTMAGASLHNRGGTALVADRVSVEGEMLLDEGFTADGEIAVRGATVSGGLSLSGAALHNPSGIALNALRSMVENGLYAMYGFVAHGAVQLRGTRVRGSINFSGASLLNPGGVALLAERLEVTGRIFCGEDFTAQGEVSLIDARIGSSVDFSSAQLSNAAGSALSAEGMTVGGSLSCNDGFTADQRISMPGARVGGELRFEDATIHDDLNLRFVHAAALRTDSNTSIDGTLDLRNATVEVLRDDPAGWPGSIRLNGFTYTTLSSPPAADRLNWLARDSSGYQPQPYEQLAAVYRAMGHDGESRTVLLAKQRIRRRSLPAPSRAWGYLQDWVVGYGYRPQWAALWLAVLLAIGTIAFATNPPAPLDRAQSPEFSPLLYTLDLLIPIAGFGQRGAFTPRGWHHWLAAGLIAAGWILATTIAAGITRVLSRQ